MTHVESTLLMYLSPYALSKLTYFFLVISLVLWLITNYFSMTCDQIEATDERQDFFKPKLPSRGERVLTDTPQNKDSQILKWFEASLPSDVPRIYGTCPPVLAAAMSTDPSTSNGQSLTVIGEINLNSSLDQFKSLQLIKESLGDTIISSFISSPSLQYQSNNDDDVTKLNAILESLRSIGVYLLSLAHQHSLDISEYGTTQTIHSIERAGLRWVGLNARQSEVLYIGHIKVGVVAFCGVHGQCLDSGTPSFAPNKFFIKSARETITKLQQTRIVHHVIVMLHWGKEQSYYPDESMLYIARHLSDIDGVSAIIGYHPQVVQGHAYFGNTLVIFSAGNFIVGSNSESLCWKKEESWIYKEKVSLCQSVHPALRESLKERELQTVLYKLKITESTVVIGHYKLLPLHDTGNIRYTKEIDTNKQWTAICGDNDDKCLSCKPF